MKSLPPGRYRAVQMPTNVEIDMDNEVYIRIPHSEWPQPGTSMIFRVIDPETHDHEGQIEPQRYRGEERWICKGCDKILTSGQYESYAYSQRVKTWLERMEADFEDGFNRSTAAGMLKFLRENLDKI